ncbi:CsbD family protein [Mesorhizobium sp. ORM6]
MEGAGPTTSQPAGFNSSDRSSATRNKGKIKEQWGKLTDDDLDRIAGKRDQLEGKIQERYGIEKDRVRADVDDWARRQGW